MLKINNTLKRVLLILTAFILLFIFLCFKLVNPVFVSRQNMFIPVNKDRLYLDVKKLTDIEPARNYKNISSLNESADYIIDEFKKLDCKLDIQKFIVKNNEYKNIVCSFNENKNTRVVVGAHYDVFGEQAGADDNASGVSGLLEIARLINLEKPNLKNRVDLVAYPLEEPPYFRTKYMGSAIHAQSLSQLKTDIKGVIIIEMIGFFTEEKNSQHYPLSFLKLLYPSEGNYIAVVGKIGQGKFVKKVKEKMIEGSNIDVKSINAPTFIQGIDFSDHLNYWKYNYNSIMITDTSFNRNKNYHKKSDVIETIDFDKMSEVIKGIYWSVINLN